MERLIIMDRLLSSVPAFYNPFSQYDPSWLPKINREVPVETDDSDISKINELFQKMIGRLKNSIFNQDGIDEIIFKFLCLAKKHKLVDNEISIPKKDEDLYFYLNDSSDQDSGQRFCMLCYRNQEQKKCIYIGYIHKNHTNTQVFSGEGIYFQENEQGNYATNLDWEGVYEDCKLKQRSILVDTEEITSLKMQLQNYKSLNDSKRSEKKTDKVILDEKNQDIEELQRENLKLKKQLDDKTQELKDKKE